MTCLHITLSVNCLTHWGRDKMAVNFLTTFSNVYSWTKIYISIKISLNFVPKGPINNIPALVQIMTWRRPGNEPLSGPVMVSFICICVTWPQWVNSIRIQPLYYNASHSHVKCIIRYIDGVSPQRASKTESDDIIMRRDPGPLQQLCRLSSFPNSFRHKSPEIHRVL